jgi:hypothetical protein
MKKLSLLALVAAASFGTFLSFFGEAHAGIVPGTLRTGDYTSSITCNNKSFTYDPSNAQCNQGACKRYSQGSSSACGSCLAWSTPYCTAMSTPYCTAYGSASCISTSSYCIAYKTDGSCAESASYCTAYGAAPCLSMSTPYCVSWSTPYCTSYPTCRHSSFGCDYYYSYVSTFSSLTKYGYGPGDVPKNEANPTYASSSDGQKLTNDLSLSCNKWAVGTPHIPSVRSGSRTCYDGDGAYNSNATYYLGGSDGVCNSF